MLALLQNGSLTVREVFQPESMGLNLSERDSTATITLGPDGPEITVGDWVQDLTEPGMGIVWRARSIDTQHDTETRTITLEHMIASLGDRIIPEEITPEDMGGTSAGVSAHTAASYVISYQNTWQLGDFEYSVNNPYKFDGDTLKGALETITGSLEDPIWEYDFGSYPFTLHIRQLSDSAGSEMRAGRNISTLKYTVDRSRMYTRFYPVGKDNLRLSGEYVSRNEDLYGRIDKTETDQSKATEGELAAWANDRLQRHAHPIVTVIISGLDLSKSTGETLDQLKIGKRCQVPLPENGSLISEKITKLSWRDKIKDPESVTVTLANAQEDVQSIIRQDQAKAGGGGRASAKANGDKIALIGQVEEGLYSAIIQTSTNIMSTVYSDLQGYSTIEQTASQISLAVATAGSNAWGMIQVTATSILSTVSDTLQGYSTIEQTASQITLAVNSAGTNLYNSVIQQTSTSIHIAVSNAATGIYSAINVQADRISLVVQGSGNNAKIKPAEIVAAINNGESSIKLRANHIELDGDTIASYVTATDILVKSLTVTNGVECQAIDCSTIDCTGINTNDGDITCGDVNAGALKGSSLKVGSYSASWKSASIVNYTLGTYRYYLYGTSTSSTTASGATGMYPVTGNSTTTIYYLGHS